MPPKKKVERPAAENISLGPQVREGEFKYTKVVPNVPTNRAIRQARLSSELHEFSLPSTTHLFTSPISGAPKSPAREDPIQRK